MLNTFIIQRIFFDNVLNEDKVIRHRVITLNAVYFESIACTSGLLHIIMINPE